MTTKKSKDNNEAAKQLLKKALATGDQELINLANQLLGEKPKKGRPAKSKVKPKKGKSGPAEFTGNTFNPEEYKNHFNEDTEWTKKIEAIRPYTVSARREALDDIEIKCSRCSRVEFLPGTFASYFGETRYHICNKCGSTR